MKNRMYYSARQKYAGITVPVDFDSFVYGDSAEKAKIVAREMQKGLHSLQRRLARDKLCIDELVTKADAVFEEYMARGSAGKR